jgi:hypothetical protein
MYVLVEESDQGVFSTPRGDFSPVPGHPPIFDAIVGDPGYSPWWQFVLWPVSDTFGGEVVTSFAAMDEAFRQGLVKTSITLPQAINCPVVLPEARLEERPGDTISARTPSPAHYKGKRVHYFSFSVVPVSDSVVSTPPAYTLRREGGELLSESVRGVDMTADGDLYDSNDLFSAAPGDAAYSDTVSLVEVVVHDGKFIDRSDSDDESELDDAADLFRDGEPDPDVVVAVRSGAEVLNRPIRPPPTAPRQADGQEGP